MACNAHIESIGKIAIKKFVFFCYLIACVSSCTNTQLDILGVIDDDVNYDFSSSNQYGNSVALFGGSIAYCANICHYYWKDVLNIDLDVYAKAGAGFTIKDNSILEQVYDACATNKYDVYLFWCSTNDYTRQAHIYSDWTDNNPFSSQNNGILHCIYHIVQSNPHAKIIFFTSMKCFDENGYTIISRGNSLSLYQYVLGQINACYGLGIPVLNQFDQYVFSIDNYKNYYTDYIHPNEMGYELISRTQALFVAKAY